jgi:hypothetical protein
MIFSYPILKRMNKKRIIPMIGMNFVIFLIWKCLVIIIPDKINITEIPHHFLF